MTVEKAVFAYVGAFVDELARLHVHHVVISPGSRSTPLAMLLNEHPQMKVWLHVDERSAAFFALGMAKKKQGPVALLCTSGTAAANYYPAVCEALHARVPLLVLTADRPPELRDVGAPQTMNQIDLYGKQVKWFMDMALPEDKVNMLAYVRTVAARAISITLEAPKGPVHLNFPFREPLVPEVAQPLVWKEGRPDGKPHVRVSSGKQRLCHETLNKLATELHEVEKGLIVCGPQEDSQLAPCLTELAQQLQFPILADPLSQIRTGSSDKTWVIDSYDAFLRDECFAETIRPEVILRFGAMPVSKPFLLYINRHPSIRQIIIESSTGWREPTLKAANVLFTDPVLFCRDLLKQLQGISTQSATQLEQNGGNDSHSGEIMDPGHWKRSEWLKVWQQVNNTSRQTIEANMPGDMFEGRVMSELSRWISESSTLFVGNSMPVRDLDTFFASNDRQIAIMGNRGVNGIDGLVSTSLGVQAISSEDESVVLVLGDLSFYHDLNGLLAAKQYDLNVTIIIVHNDGGGIFSFLAQAQPEHGRHFETLFGTPIDLDYEHVVSMYGGHFQRVQDWPSFRSAVEQGMHNKGLHVVEIRTDREHNVEQHRALFQKVADAIQPLLAQGKV